MTTEPTAPTETTAPTATATATSATSPLVPRLLTALLIATLMVAGLLVLLIVRTPTGPPTMSQDECYRMQARQPDDPSITYGWLYDHGCYANVAR